MDIVQIIELVGAAVGGGWVSHLLTIRSRVRQEKAGASKAEAEAKADEIENIRKTMDAVYKPIIDDLKNQVSELRQEVKEVREENERLKDENDKLRDAIREIQPDLLPSKRSENARRQARGRNGQFTKEAQS